MAQRRILKIKTSPDVKPNNQFGEETLNPLPEELSKQAEGGKD